MSALHGLGRRTRQSAWLDEQHGLPQILQQFVIYNVHCPQSAFPKTRRIVFLGNRSATLPGWVELAIEE